MRPSRLFMFALCIGALAGCAKDLSGNRYSAKTAAVPTTTYQAVVLSARDITITRGDQLDDNGWGMVLGGVGGGLAGNLIGQGKGNTIATVGGVVAGAALGALAQQSLGEQPGIEYVVKYWEVETGTVTNYDYAKTSCKGGRTECLTQRSSVAAQEKIVTLVQGIDPRLAPGQKAFLMVSSQGRSRLVPDASAAQQINQDAIDNATAARRKKRS
ncbi:MAG: glycine zipper 2TM domain-containing protein [Holosporales bacterium]